MGRGILAPVCFPVAHFFDETLPHFYYASLQLGEGSEAQLIEIVRMRRVRTVVGMVND